MNIFVLDKDPKKCAEYHCDRHMKMIVESAQMLSTALHEYGTVEGIYKSTHKNHPCSVWTRQSRSNYIWLCELSVQLLNEYAYRYGKLHKTSDIIWKCIDNAHLIPEGKLTKHPLCMPDDCKINNDVVKSYRNYYMLHKKNFATWKTKTPKWFSVK